MTEIAQGVAVRPYPRGVRPHFFEAAERRRGLESDVFESLRGAGYREIILPVVDSSEPYREIVDEVSRRRSYRFIDREGELLEIRSDFTPMVARALSPMIDPLELPLRVSYRGDVVRCESGRLGDDGEFYQIGAELLGVAGGAGDAELLALAVSAARTGGVEPTVMLSNERLIERIIEPAKTGLRPRLRRAIANKHLDEVERLSLEMSGDSRNLLLSVCSGTVTTSELRAQGLEGIVDTIETVQAALQGVDVTISWDDVSPEQSYYTGIRFKLFDGSGRVEIGQGGRYDDLYGAFGVSVAAVGFTLSLDRLEAVR